MPLRTFPMSGSQLPGRTPQSLSPEAAQALGNCYISSLLAPTRAKPPSIWPFSRLFKQFESRRPSNGEYRPSGPSPTLPACISAPKHSIRTHLRRCLTKPLRCQTTVQTDRHPLPSLRTRRLVRLKRRLGTANRRKALIRRGCRPG